MDSGFKSLHLFHPLYGVGKANWSFVCYCRCRNKNKTPEKLMPTRGHSHCSSCDRRSRLSRCSRFWHKTNIENHLWKYNERLSLLSSDYWGTQLHSISSWNYRLIALADATSFVPAFFLRKRGSKTSDESEIKNQIRCCLLSNYMQWDQRIGTYVKQQTDTAACNMSPRWPNHCSGRTHRSSYRHTFLWGLKTRYESEVKNQIRCCLLSNYMHASHSTLIQLTRISRDARRGKSLKVFAA
jgi:hypothetical protein